MISSPKNMKMLPFNHFFLFQQSLETIIILFQIKCETVETRKTMVGNYKCVVCRGPNPKYSFPTDEKILEKWMQLLNLQKKPNRRAKLCEKHFRYSDLYITNKQKCHKVKKGALPFCINFIVPDTIWISKSGEEITCHKAMLAAQSPYLRSILTSMENCETGQYQYIVTPEMTSEAIKIILGRQLQNKSKN